MLRGVKYVIMIDRYDDNTTRLTIAFCHSLGHLSLYLGTIPNCTATMTKVWRVSLYVLQLCIPYRYQLGILMTVLVLVYFVVPYFYLLSDSSQVIQYLSDILIMHDCNYFNTHTHTRSILLYSICNHLVYFVYPIPL